MVFGIVFLLGVLLVGNVYARSYYVDATNGNDSWQGNITHPWKTIYHVTDYGNSYNFNIGDDIFFKRGEVFSDYRVFIHHGGNSTDRAIFGAYGEGDKPRFKYNYSPVLGGFELAEPNLSYITIQDIKIEELNDSQGVVFYEDNASNVVISGVEIDGNSNKNGILLYKINNYVVENCVLQNIASSGIVIYGSENYSIRNGIIRNNSIDRIFGEDGITIHKDGDGWEAGPNHTVTNNYVSSANENGFDFTSGEYILVENNTAYNSTSAGFVIGHNASHIVLRRNRAYDNNDNFDYLVGGDSYNVSLYYNLAYGSSAHSVGVKEDNTSLVSVYNNLFSQNSVSSSSMDFSDYIKNITLKNNLVYFSGTVIARFLDDSWSPNNDTLVMDNNFYYGYNFSDSRHFYDGSNGQSYTFAQFKSSYNHELNSLYNQTPKFVDFENNNFQLQWNSPAIDVGLDLGLTEDYFGNPIYGTPDIGAFEYQPPYNISSDEINATKIRIYSDGKYRDM